MNAKPYFLATALSCATLLSCSKDANLQVANTDSDQTNLSTLTVSINGGTKSTDDWSEEDVSLMNVYVFDSNDEIEASTTVSNATSATLSVSQGSGKSVYVIVNYSVSGIVYSVSDLTSLTSELGDNSTSAFVMSGYEKNLSITSETSSLSIEVSRLAAKISIARIDNEISETAYSESFTITGIYLVNAVGGYCPVIEDSYTPSLWLNKISRSSEGYDSYLYDSESCSLLTGFKYTVEHTFYCYPNPTETDSSDSEWCERKTRLVVEATVNGTTCYYPITLDEVERNTHYHIAELDITRRGSSSADEPISTSDLTVSIDIVDWNYSETELYTI